MLCKLHEAAKGQQDQWQHRSQKRFPVSRSCTIHHALKIENALQHLATAKAKSVSKKVHRPTLQHWNLLRRIVLQYPDPALKVNERETEAFYDVKFWELHFPVSKAAQPLTTFNTLRCGKR